MPALPTLRRTVSKGARVAALTVATGTVVKLKSVNAPVGPLVVVGNCPPPPPLKSSITPTSTDCPGWGSACAGTAATAINASAAVNAVTSLLLLMSSPLPNRSCGTSRGNGPGHGTSAVEPEWFVNEPGHLLPLPSPLSTGSDCPASGNHRLPMPSTATDPIPPVSPESSVFLGLSEPGL